MRDVRWGWGRKDIELGLGWGYISRVGGCDVGLGRKEIEFGMSWGYISPVGDVSWG